MKGGHSHEVAFLSVGRRYSVGAAQFIYISADRVRFSHQRSYEASAAVNVFQAARLPHPTSRPSVQVTAVTRSATPRSAYQRPIDITDDDGGGRSSPSCGQPAHTRWVPSDVQVAARPSVRRAACRTNRRGGTRSFSSIRPVPARPAWRSDDDDDNA